MSGLVQDSVASPAGTGYTPPPQRGRYENMVVAIMSATFGLVFFDRLALNFLTPYFQGELGLSNADIGLLGGLPALTWAVSGFLMGFISERMDRRKPFLIAAIVMFTVFSAMSGFVGGLASLLLLRALMGAAEGAILPLGQPMVLFSSTPKRRGLNMGLVQSSSAGLLGGVVGPIVTVALAENFGWRTAFFVSIVPGLIMAAIVLLVLKELRLKHPATQAVSAEGAADAAAGTSHAVMSMGLLSALKERNIILCLLMSVCYLTWFLTTQIFMPLYLTNVKQFEGPQLAIVLPALGFAWVLWGAVVPGISDKIGRRAAILIFTAIAVFAPILVLFVDSPGLLFVGLIATYTGLGCFAIFMVTIPAETVPPYLVASCLGLIMGVGEVTGGFLVPWLAGALSDQYGLGITMWMSSGAAVLVFLLALGLKETAPALVRKRQAMQPAGEQRAEQ